MKMKFKILVACLILALVCWEVCALDYCIWELGDDEAPPDYTGRAFDEFDQSGFDPDYYIDTEPVSEFPKEINDGTVTQIYIHYTLNSEEANDDLSLVLDTLYASHEDSNSNKIIPYYTLRIKIGSGKDKLTSIGEYKFGSADSDYPENRTITISKKYLNPGENIILLENANSKWSGHWMVWDSLKLQIGGGGSPPKPFNMWHITAILFVILTVAILLFRIHKKPPKEDGSDNNSEKIEKEKKIKEKVGEPHEKVRYILNENELKIINLLSKEDNLIQTEICNRTSLRRSNVSNCVNRLESQRIIQRQEVGTGKHVSLEEWVKNLLCGIKGKDRERWMSVVLVLREEKNMIQKELSQKTQIPESTLSKMISQLEKRQIIKTEKNGMSNIVQLLKYQKTQ